VIIKLFNPRVFCTHIHITHAHHRESIKQTVVIEVPCLISKCFRRQKMRMINIGEQGFTTFFSGVPLLDLKELVFNMRLLHAVAFSKKLPWFEPTNVISLKTQQHAVNACVKRSSQRSFKWYNLVRCNQKFVAKVLYNELIPTRVCLFRLYVYCLK